MEAVPETSPVQSRRTVLLQATTRRSPCRVTIAVSSWAATAPELHAVAQGGPARFAVLLRHEGREPLAPDHVLLLVADQLQEEGIAISDDAFAVEEHGDELDGLEDVAHAPLGLAHGLLRPAALGDVEGGHQGGRAPAEVERAARELHPSVVGAREARLVAEAGHRGRRRLQDAMTDDLMGVGMEAVEEGAIDEVGGRGPGQGRRRLVGVADVALVDDEDGGGGALEDGAELLLAAEDPVIGDRGGHRLRSARGRPSGEDDADGHAQRHEHRHDQHGRQTLGASHAADLTAWDDGS